MALRGELTSEPIQQAGHRPDKEARTEAAAVVCLPRWSRTARKTIAIGKRIAQRGDGLEPAQTEDDRTTVQPATRPERSSRSSTRLDSPGQFTPVNRQVDQPGSARRGSAEPPTGASLGVISPRHRVAVWNRSDRSEPQRSASPIALSQLSA